VPYDVKIQTAKATPVASIAARVSFDGISDFVGRAFQRLYAHVLAHEVTPAGPAMVLSHGAGDPAWVPRELLVEACLPVASAVAATDDIAIAEIAGGAVASTMHTGAYAGLEAARQALVAWMVENGCACQGPVRFVYHTSIAAATDCAALRTEVACPVRRSVSP
jgi:effector-binding domain-containing protein